MITVGRAMSPQTGSIPVEWLLHSAELAVVWAVWAVISHRPYHHDGTPTAVWLGVGLVGLPTPCRRRWEVMGLMVACLVRGISRTNRHHTHHRIAVVLVDLRAAAWAVADLELHCLHFLLDLAACQKLRKIGQHLFRETCLQINFLDQLDQAGLA